MKDINTSIQQLLDNKDIQEQTIEKEEKKQPKKKTNNNRGKRKRREQFETFDGHPLTPQEAQFIDIYIAEGNGRKAVLDAGYKTKAPGQYAQALLNKAYITGEINHRLETLKSQKIADAQEILEYFSSVMRGEITDQFGLEAPLSERTKAAQELAKRKIDIPQRLQGNEQPEVKITLDWARPQ